MLDCWSVITELMRVNALRVKTLQTKLTERLY